MGIPRSTNGLSHVGRVPTRLSPHQVFFSRISHKAQTGSAFCFPGFSPFYAGERVVFVMCSAAHVSFLAMLPFHTELLLLLLLLSPVDWWGGGSLVGHVGRIRGYGRK